MIKKVIRVKGAAIFFWFALMLCLPFTNTIAETVNFEISLDKNTVSRGKQVELKCLFLDNENIPAPTMPFIRNLVFKYKSSVNDTIEKNGKKRKTVAHIYRVVPLKDGSYRIGPLSFKFDGNTYISNEVSLEVGKKGISRYRDTILEKKSNSTQDISKRIYIKAELSKDRAFINEKMYLTLLLYSDWLDLENIVIEDVNSVGLVAGKFERENVEIAEIEGVKYAVLEYVMWFFSPEAGVFSIKPVKVDLDVARLRQKTDGGEPAFLNNNQSYYDDFIGAADSKHLVIETKPLKISVLPLPSKDKPDAFKGAIGQFSFDMDASPLRVKIGDAITLKMTIKGRGNENTINVPVMENIEGANLYEPQISMKPGEVIFERVLRVESDKFSEIPKAIFTFFDPEKGKYISIVRGPLKVEIEGLKGLKAASKKPEEKEAAKEKGAIVGIKDKPGSIHYINPYFYRSRGFFFILIFPLCLLCSAYIVYRRVRRFETDPVYAAWVRASKDITHSIRKLEALSKGGKVPQFYKVGFNAMQRYFALRLFLPAEGVTAGVIGEELALKIDNIKILEDIKEIFSELYLAKFTNLEFDRKDTEATLEKIKRIAVYLNEKDKL